jgi:hypothetical protein
MQNIKKWDTNYNHDSGFYTSGYRLITVVGIKDPIREELTQEELTQAREGWETGIRLLAEEENSHN